MTNAEAIKTLRANRPDPCFEMLRDAVDVAIKALEAHTDGDTISRQAAIDLVEGLESAWLKGEIDLLYPKVVKGLIGLPSAQPEEVIPHRNYKYLSDYWCECGWHLGKKGEVKYCSECGRKVNWDE